MEMNWKQLKAESVSSKFKFALIFLIIIEATDFFIHPIFKFKQYENANIANCAFR